MTLLMIKKQQLLHAFQQNYKVTAHYAKAFTNLDFSNENQFGYYFIAIGVNFVCDKKGRKKP